MDIHAPSVAAASQSTSETTNDDSKSLLELISEKDKVEAELKALSDVLESVCLAATYLRPATTTTSPLG